METKFQTSFIPRRPLPNGGSAPAPMPAHQAGKGGNMFMTLATIILLISLGGIAGAYLWKQYLVSQQAQLKSDLVAREQQFDINLIRQMKAESTKINLAKGLITNHISTSKLFGILSSFTVENIRFLTMDFTTPNDPSGNNYVLALTGYGKDLSTVAFQAQVLNQLTSSSTIIRNPIVSNPSFNADGTITFSLKASIDPAALQYTPAAGSVSGTAPAAPSAPAVPARNP